MPQSLEEAKYYLARSLDYWGPFASEVHSCEECGRARRDHLDMLYCLFMPNSLFRNSSLVSWMQSHGWVYAPKDNDDGAGDNGSG